MPPFEGFADDQGKFFRALAKHQDRDWFQARKAEFEVGWNAPMKSLLGELADKIDPLYPHCDLDEPKVFRIFRDVRFSKDKSPYKTHIGGHISTKRGTNSPSGPSAIYVHVGGKERFAAAGHYKMDGPDLTRYRTAVADDKGGKELLKILGALAKKGFTTQSHGEFKRVPKGFAPDHPRADLLKYQGLVANFPAFPPGLLATPKLLPWLTQHAKQVSPLIEWLVFATA